MQPRLVLILSALLLGGCSGLSGSARTTFDQVALNQTWYGAYHRPLPDADTGGARAEREQTAERRRDARERAQRERAEARAQNRGQNDRTTSSPTTANGTNVVAAADVSIRDAEPRTYDAEYAAAYVRDVYALNETAFGDGQEVVDMYRWAQENGTIYHNPRPAVGDLVFFHNTHDANADGRPNDWFTHIGIVEMVDDADTVTVLSYVDGDVGRIYMNRGRPGDERASGQTLNTPLRSRTRQDPPHTEYLAGHLFAGFGSLLGERTQVVVLDQWSPAESATLQARR